MTVKIIDTNFFNVTFERNLLVFRKGKLSALGVSLENLKLADGDQVDVDGAIYTLGQKCLEGTKPIYSNSIPPHPPQYFLREQGFLYT